MSAAALSTLVDGLLAEGFGDLTVLDLSDAALRVARNRLGARGEEVRWIAGDITGVDLPEATYDVWHDRAVFHFLTTAEARRAYVRQVMKAVRHGGHVIVATFRRRRPDRMQRPASHALRRRRTARRVRLRLPAHRAPRRTPRHSRRPGPALRLLPLPETPVSVSEAGLRSARPAMRTTFHDIRHFFGPRPDKLPSRGKPLANQEKAITPGGVAGLQIRWGTAAVPGWVRLPLPSANSPLASAAILSLQDQASISVRSSRSSVSPVPVAPLTSAPRSFQRTLLPAASPATRRSAMSWPAARPFQAQGIPASSRVGR